MGILSFDVGTTAMKTCLFGDDLQLRLCFTQEYPLLTPAPGIVELDSDVYWRALRGGIRRVLDAGVAPGEIYALSITSQGETLIPVDAEVNPLANAIVWLDARAGEQADELSARLNGDSYYQTTGLPDLNGATPVAKLMWIRDQWPDVYKTAHKFLLLEDYLILRLTGELVSEHSLLSSTGYFDIRARDYAAHILSAAGINRRKLPEALPSGVIAGRVTGDAARATGLLAGTPIATSAMDQICGMVGAGNTREGILTETTGTCLTVGASVKSPIFDSPARPCIYAHFDDGFAYQHACVALGAFYKPDSAAVKPAMRR